MIFDLQKNILKLIKTRELFVIEANVPFMVDQELICEESYKFPSEYMLINSNPKHFRNLREIFKAKSKSEVLELTFLEDSLIFKGDINKNMDYTIQSKQFENYGNYMENGHERSKQFKINVSMKHILATIKISDLIEGNFCVALDLQSPNECYVFLFTDSYTNDFNFVIGIGCVSFSSEMSMNT